VLGLKAGEHHKQGKRQTMEDESTLLLSTQTVREIE
jgi:hypothetical protein